jgi:PAS domain S-box-containing protein
MHFGAGESRIGDDLVMSGELDEKTLPESERYRALIEAIADYAIYMLDPSGRVASWNPGARRFKGYEEREIIGQHFGRFYTDEDQADGLPARALETARTEGRFESEGWRVRKDGTRFWAHVVIDPIRSSSGDLLGFAKITRDVSERRETQIQLEHAREQLLQAQKMEAIGQLTGGVAHDFNNLLTAVLSSLELVRKYLPDDPRVTRLIDNAVQGAQRGATLTQRLLAYARRQPLKIQAVEIPGLIDGLIDLIVPSLGPATRIETDFEGDALAAVTDPGQLETAILNLCVNSRDAMPQGGIITISARNALLEAGNPQGLEPGTYVCLAVADKGEGMDADVLARAAEPFFTTKGIGKGSGLGLPMVHGLAAQSGGRLLLKSSRGDGTTAELWLPAATAATPASPPQQETAEPASKPLNILVVDDDALVLMNTAMMLEDLGHTVHEVTGGKAALAVLESGEPIDLVVSDHAMPGMTGSQLAIAIHMIWPDMPILLATGYAELPRGSAVELPRLSKPFSQQDLAKAVSDVVRR